MSPSGSGIVSDHEIRCVPISSIRRDGQTQHRLTVDAAIVAEYAELMRAGVMFPPVRIWWDGTDLWLSDGFQRIEAANQTGLTEISAEVCLGSLSEAKWDSYAANSTHGLRRTVEETKQIVQLALQHPNAAQLSNVELAKHLHLSEATLRRWRKRVSSSTDEDGARIVRRGKTRYELATKRIGKTWGARRAKSRGDLRLGIEAMKEGGSTKARRLLIVLGNWAFGCASNEECLAAIEQVLRD